MWKFGMINGYEYEAKVFDLGSEYGINGGRISKLFVKKDGRVVINYDRGWDVRPKTKEAKQVLAEILRIYSLAE